ncbi:TonB-linked outer membrane protein, SusC/RagA family [Chitinophaga costaii]|uniref:TonB-linked outer membrane protein, SusC/RagA family n=1 Tax=Chitinophaga costaii TaxID=1335309 RepID=A0A1C4ELS3_9BACT|nr:SusC/RagA family TonB-linked outer membrane protein [Chitinophaga costaii]PUZ22431.1 SusC/RagA family TonB-linked outer membrane protein [Chitinophaga costaii]SCC44523.1 TonB-linked outer membrane protein, SusC/RagA family [Chitinophaga costaii]
MQPNVCGSFPPNWLRVPFKRLRANQLKRTLSLITLLLCFSAAALGQRITLTEKNESTVSILNKIQQQSGYDIFYKKNIVQDIKINVNLINVTLETALKTVLGYQNLEFSIEDKVITISLPPKSKNTGTSTPAEKIKGTVVDEEGKPMPGATIQIVGKNVLGFRGSDDGTFDFSPSPGDTVIRVSFVGYKTQLIRIVPGKTNYKITLPTNDARLKDVVVTGIFDKPKESFTGAVTVITKEQIKMYGNRNLLKTIGNIDPSFDIQERNNLGSDPNSLPDIEIRGSTTLANINDLQSNVRNTLNLPLFILDGFEVSLQRVYDMNQNDVESVVILKDASSTAMYGSRGANGVVVITSIKPVSGKLRISYATGLNLEIPDLSSIHRLNATEKLALEKSVGLYSSTDLSSQATLSDLYNANLKSIKEGVNTNWARVPLRTGIGQYHKLDLSGGDAQFRYIMNVSYDQVTGAMKGSKRDNINGSMSIAYLLPKVRFTNNLGIGINNSANSTWGDYSNYVLMNPYWNPYNTDGSSVMQFNTFSGTQANPAYNGSLTDFNKAQYTMIRNTTAVDWDITPTLKWSNSAGYTRQIGSADVFKSPSNIDFLQFTQKGSYAKTNSMQQGYQFRTNLSYGQVFGRHSVYVGANAQVVENKNNANSFIVVGFANDQQTDISNGASYSGNQPSTTEATVRSLGFSGTANYNFDGRYFADASYNMEGGSSFGPNTRYGKFYSAGFGWTVSNEKIFKDNVTFINLLRLRYNYGVTGGLNFAPYQSLTTYTYDRTQLYRSMVGTTLTGIGNPDLSWQNTYQQNFGADVSIFNGRVSLDFNYYKKRTPNTITQATLPLSHGFNSYTENLGQVNNSGYDFSASVYILRNNEKKFSWSIQVAAYSNKNVLVKLSDALKEANKTPAGTNSDRSFYYEYVEGQSIDEIYVLKSPGVDAATGKVLYQNIDGTVSNNISGFQKIAVGSSQPKINGRLSTSVRYGSFVANLGFAARFGGKKLNQTLMGQVENAYVRTNVDRRVLSNRWQKPGDIAPYKSLLNNTSTLANDRFVFTENTILFNSVNIMYELPARWLSRINIQHLGISASMSDLSYWSNIDQERGTSYPYTLKPTFALSCTF